MSKSAEMAGSRLKTEVQKASKPRVMETEKANTEKSQTNNGWGWPLW